MAQADGVLVTLLPYDSLELVNRIPIGPLITPFELTEQPLISEFVPNRFPVPPTAAGFITDVEDETRKMTGVTQTIVSALSPAGSYLEPTIGQIWPR